MRIEIPELKRCCFCIPLRRGLLFWVYLKLVFGLLILLYNINCIFILYLYNADLYLYIVISIALIVILVEISFCIVFINSAHRKDHKDMRMYYRYSIGVLMLVVTTMLGFLGLEIVTAVTATIDIWFDWEFLLESICFVFLQIVTQAYLVILVRSELLKLEKNTKFQFINHTSEPHCEVQITL